MMDDSSQINYDLSLKYWANVPPTVDGVLGGFGYISKVDIEGSKLFLKSIFTINNSPQPNIALDCGAGIGRITKHLLLPSFRKVDVIEPNEKFIKTILDFVGKSKEKIETLYKVSLQEFAPEKKYDIIWNQWVLGYLTNEDLVSYLKRCSDALSENGVIIVKENVTSSGTTESDDTDSSVTRSLREYIRIFKCANLKRIKQCKQTNFPNVIYPVYMFALVPNIRMQEKCSPMRLRSTYSKIDIKK